MADIFDKADSQKLLHKKNIYFVGDSNVRSMYKDLVQLVTKTDLLTYLDLKQKLEDSFNGDHLVAKGNKTNGRDYREERVFQMHSENFTVAIYFYYVTRCYSQYVEEIFQKMRINVPDVVVYNSCVWDISRWGPTSIQKYQEIFPTFISRLKEMIPKECLFIWLTVPLLGEDINGAFLVQELAFLAKALRAHVIQANFFTGRLMAEAKYDVLDLQFYLSKHLHRREADGVHWEPTAVRYETMLLLTRIALSWNRPLPNKHSSRQLRLAIEERIKLNNSVASEDSVE